jgi:hypothetical protein
MKSSENFKRRYTQDEVDQIKKELTESIGSEEIKIFTFEETHKKLRISARTLRNYVSKETIEFVKVAPKSKVTFRKEHILRYLERYTHGGNKSKLDAI